MQPLEYKILRWTSEADEDDLNELGAEGWQLASYAIDRWSHVNERKGYTESGETHVYHFVRPKQAG